LQRVFSESGAHYRQFQEHFRGFYGEYYKFEILLNIFYAAKEDYESGFLFNLRSLVKAELLDDSLEQAKTLLDSGYTIVR
jgi:hypothetical protein